MVMQHFRVSPLSGLRLEMDRVFDRMFSGGTHGLPAWEHAYPALNAWEEDAAFVVQAEVPGMEMPNLDISLKGDQLSLRGRMDSGGPDDAAWHRRERTTGEFERVITLPVQTSEEAVEATLEAGVLTIRLPKAAKVLPRKIEVKLLK